MNKVLIVGAGLAGATVARVLADSGVGCHLIERRHHIAGMCYASRDEETGIMIHRFGPHIFHTSDEKIWDFVNRFDAFYPWINRVKAINRHGVFSMPINLHTINQLFGMTLSPVKAREFIQSKQDISIHDPQNAEEQLLRFVGREIYEAFFLGYTTKQWGVAPCDLSAEIIKRIPIRFNYDDNYYFSKYQGFPVSGYTRFVERMLQHDLITVETGCSFEKDMLDKYDHCFFSGPLDEFFDYSFGELGYRTVTFELERGIGDLQGNACINYTELEIPWTRMHEHKYFTPWENYEKSLIMREFSKEATRYDDRFYPKRMPLDIILLNKYESLKKNYPNVTFIGRLGQYLYMDMDAVIKNSIYHAENWLKLLFNY